MKKIIYSVVYVFIAVKLIALSFNHIKAAHAAEPSATQREYPGGADEQDLRVQTEMTDPTLKTDRRTFEQNIMKNIFKKNTSSSDTEEKTSDAKSSAKASAKAPAAPVRKAPARKAAPKKSNSKPAKKN